MAINREISQFSNFVSVDDNTKKVSISTSFDIGGDSVISGDVTVGTATTGVVARTDGTLNVSGISTFQDDVHLGDSDTLYFGDGDDLRIRHVTGDSYITDSATLNINTADNLEIANISGVSKRAKFKSSTVELYSGGDIKFETTTDGFKVLNGTSETAVISGPQNIILDPSPDDVVAIVEGDISAAGVSTITGITTTNIVVGNLIQEVDGVISTGTTITSVGASQVGISKTSLGSATNQEFVFVNQTPTGIVRVKGDLYIDGTRTEINSTTLTVDDLNVVVASGAENGLSADGAGLTVDGADAYLKYNYNAGTNENWEINKNLNIGIAATSTDLPGLYLKGNSDTANFLQNPSISIGGTTNSKYYDTFLVDAPFVQYVRHWANGFDINFSVQDARQFVVSNTDGANSITAPGVLDNQIAFKVIPESSTELRYNKVKKLETTGYGVSVTDGLNVSGISTFQDDVNIGTGGTTAFFDISSGKVGIGTTIIVNGSGNVQAGSGRLFFPLLTSGSLLGDKKAIISAGNPTTDYGLFVVDTLNDPTPALRQKYVRQYTSGYYTVSVGSTNAFVVSNSDTTSVGAVDPAGTPDYDVAFVVNPDTSTELRYNYTKKLETTGYGVSVTDGLNVSGISTFASDLDINADVNVSGIVTARSFVGSGELLTNLDAYAAYTSDRSTLATIADKISGIATYSEDQGFNYLGGNESFHTNSFFYGVDIEASDDGKVMFVSSLPNSTGNQAGCGVQIYERTNSNFNYVGFVTSLSHHTLGAGQTVGDLGTWFGPTLASNADASIFAVGSPNVVSNNSGSDNQYGWWDSMNTWEGRHGCVNIFQKTGNNIEPLGILTAPDSNSSDASQFGQALAFSSDGTKLYVSAVGIETNTYGLLGNGTSQHGLVYAYNKVGTSYQQVGVLTSYRPNDVTLPHTWGHRVVCSDDGDTIYISGPSENSTNSYDREGLVEVYSRTGNTFTHVGILTCMHDPNVDLIWNNADFGISMDCSSDGNIIAIAANPQYNATQTPQGGYGALFVFEKTGTNTFSKIVEEVFDANTVGTNVTLEIGKYDLRVNSDASVIVMSASEVTSAGSDPGGHFVAFSRDGGNISKIGAFTPLTPQPSGATFDFMMFGNSLAIDSTGDNIFVGAPIHPLGSTSNSLADKGSAYVFNITRQIALHSNQITGNIGIGTDNPTSSLEVNGTLKVSGISTFSGDLNIDKSDPTIYLKDDTSDANNNNYEIANAGGYLWIRNTTDNKYLIRSTQSDNLQLYGNGTTVLETNSSGIDITGITTISQQLLINDFANTSSAFGTKLYVNGPSVFQDNVRVGVGGTIGDLLVSGKVGIGSTQPTAKLDVDGTLNVSGISTFQDNIGISSGKSIQHIAEPQFNDNAHKAILSYGSTESTPSGTGGDFYREYAFHHNAGAGTTGTYYQRVNNNIDYEIGIDYNRKFAIGNHNQRPLHSDYTSFEVVQDGETKLYYNYNKKLETTGYGVSVTGDINVTGTASSITFDPNNNNGKTFFIRGEGNGNATIENDDEMYVSSTHLYIQNPGGTTTMAEFIEDGAVKLNHNNGTKLQTHDYGIDVTGRVETDTLNVSGIATAQKFVGDGSELTNLPPAGSDLVSYASASDISNSALSISGISTYNEVGILTGAHATVNDTFGYSVATSADGKTIVVGAYDDEIPGALLNSGVVYVYDREGNNFNEVGILTGSYATNNNDAFGYSVATSADGKTIIVSARSDETSGTDGYGLVYVFDREGNNFNEVGILTGSYASDNSDRFGDSVATSADGKTIIVGAAQDEHPTSADSSGVVYVFDREGNNFNEVGILTGSYASDISDDFGYSVATSADGKTIVVGALRDEVSPSGIGTYGVVYVYDREGNNFNEVGILTGTHAIHDGDRFGESVAITADGKNIIVGASVDEIGATTSTGVVYVFDREGNNFNEVGILTGTHASSGDNFGQSVATSADGNTIVVGAYDDGTSGTNSGLVYIFNRQGNNFNEVGILTGTYASDNSDRFGYSVATSADGKNIIVGAYRDEIGATTGTGVVYVYDQERETYVFSDADGNIGIGSAQPTAKLDVKGTLNVSGAATFQSTVNLGDNDRLNFSDTNTTIYGANNALNIEASGTHDILIKSNSSGATNGNVEISAGTDGGKVYLTGGGVGIYHTDTALKLETTGGGVTITGIATAQKFVGDGSELTNLPPAGSDLVTYASASNIANSAESISGISSYIQLDSLLASQTAGAARPWEFGHDNAMSADSSTLIVAAPKGTLNGIFDNIGVVYVFDREGNSYREVGILTAGTYADDFDNFGSSVACSTDGRRIVVGAWGDEPLGSTGAAGGLVHIFDRQGDTFTRVGVLTGSYASQSGDSFGYSVDCSGDGNAIVVGAKFDETGASASTGVVYVFDRSGNNFTEVGIITSSSNAASDVFGHSVSISEDGNTIVASAIGDNNGAVYVFDRTGTNTFNEVGILTGGTYADDGSEFGTQVKISSNGKTIVVGCPNAEVDEAVNATGLVHVFDRNPDNTFTRVGVLTGSHASQSSDAFGNYIDVSADGNTIAVGADFDELTGGNSIYDDDGLGYIFTRQGDTFEEVSTFIQGRVPTLSADGKTVAFGDPNYESGGNGAGRVLIFEQQRQTYLHSTSTGNIGIGVTNPTAKLDVDGSIAIKNHSIVSITTSHTASAGTPFTIDTFATSENDLAEYTMHVGYGTYIQAQKVLVMHNGTTAYAQESAVMYQPGKIVSISATISGGNVLLQATPKTGVSGITTYKIVRGGLV